MMKTRHYKQSGFTLLEILLTVGIFAALLVAFMLILQDYSRKEVARATNKYFETVADGAVQVLRNYDNFNAFYALSAAPNTGYQLFADSTLGTQNNNIAPIANPNACSFVLATLPPTTVQCPRIIPANFRPQSPLGSPVRILLSGRIIAGKRQIEIVVITARPRPSEIVRLAAGMAGANAAVVAPYAAKNVALLSNAYASWTKPFFSAGGGGLQGTAWYTGEMAASTTAASVYFAHYRYVSEDDVIGDYLYRRNTGVADHNTMHAPLSLGSNDILGTDNISIGTAGGAFTAADFAAIDPRRAACGGNGTVMCINGTGIVKGTATVRNTITVLGSAHVGGPSATDVSPLSRSFRANNVTIRNGLTAVQKTTYNAQGMMVVDGDGVGGVTDSVNVGTDANLSNGLAAGRGLGVQTTTATEVAMPDGSTYSTGTINATERITATRVRAGYLTADGHVKAGNVVGGTINVNNATNNARTGVIDIKANRLVYGTAAAPRDLYIGNGTITGNMSVTNFGRCDDGCGE